MSLRSLSLALLCAAMTACAHDPKPSPSAAPPVTVQQVTAPVPVACISPDFPKAPPAFADTPTALKAARDLAARDALLKGAWPEHQIWEATLWAQVQACR
jgi:hypothetical protein